jgi:hypothetical protein
MDPAYVHISTQEKAAVEKNIAELRQKSVYNIGRYGSWTYNSMEDCMTMADEIVQLIKNEK